MHRHLHRERIPPNGFTLHELFLRRSAPLDPGVSISRMRKKAGNMAVYGGTIGRACEMLGDIDAWWGREPGGTFSYVSCEARVAKDHPLRVIREIVNAALATLSPEFEKLYARLGRPSIAPEKLLRALLLQAFYSVRSERQLMEQLDYNLLFRWFVGLGMDTPIWDATVFTKNRERLVEGEIASKFMAAVLSQPRVRELSSEHFSVDGTLIEA